MSHGSTFYFTGENYGIKKAPTFNEQVEHHIAHYDGHFPIWAIIDFFSIGMLSYFYRGMKNKDKTKIAQTIYGVNYQTLERWLRYIPDLRNRCAHYSRIYYLIFPATPKMPTGKEIQKRYIFKAFRLPLSLEIYVKAKIGKRKMG